LKVKIDENLPESLVSLFAEFGHEAMTVSMEELSGYEDGDLFEIAKSEKRLFITLDLDFSDIRVFPPNTHYGIIVIRSKSNGRNTVIKMIRSLLQKTDIESLRGFLAIISDDNIRIRKH